LEFFFRRLEEYIEVRPTSAMKDIIVKIMVEVLSILGIVTKEIRQGQTGTYLTVDISPQIYLSVVAFLKKRIGRKDVEEALQRLDHLTQEEARMAAAEVLTIACAIDDKVKAVDDKVTDVRDKVKDVDDKVEGVDKRVQSVDTKVEGINNHVQSLDNLVQILDSDVQSVGYKVGSVIQGKPYLRSYLSLLSSAFNSSGVKGTMQAVQLVANQVTDINCSSSSILITADHETLTSVAGSDLRKDIQKWIYPPDPSVNYNTASGAHQEGTAAWCIKGNTLADWKATGSLLWIHGKRTYSIVV
jgi:archaellum component FlaC